MEKKAIVPEGGAPPKGPYSPAVLWGDLVFVSGQGAVEPGTGELKLSTAPEEFTLAMENVKSILEAAGSSLDKVLKVTLYLADMNDFQAVNEIYAGVFTEPFPARTTIQAGRLPLGLHVEVDVIASR